MPQSGPPARKKRWITPVLGVVAALAIGLTGGVLIGRSGASAAATSPAGFTRGQYGGAGQASGAAASGGLAGLTAGTIVSVNGSTIVVKGQDGTQKTIDTTSSTRVTESTTSTVSALKAGESVTVIGATDSSGNVTAKTISEGAATRAGLGAGARGGAAGSAG
jgi:Domain of unknown function (DUF5666)